MSKTFERIDPVPLWPGGAPGALGNGPEDCPVLRPFVRRGGDPVAAVVAFPGGGYEHRAPHEADPIAQWMNSLGLAAAVLEYRVAPYRHPQPLNDAQRAIRLMRLHASQWGIDPGRVGVLEFSAGGHLALTAATIFDAGNPQAADPAERQSCRPDALIACYPVVSFGDFGHLGSARTLFGADPTEAQRRELSLQNRVTPRTPPTFVWHTAADETVPVENSLLLASALSRHKVSFELHIFPKGRHGLGLAPEDPEVRQWMDLCAEWLRGIGFLPRR